MSNNDEQELNKKRNVFFTEIRKADRQQYFQSKRPQDVNNSNAKLDLNILSLTQQHQQIPLNPEMEKLRQAIDVYVKEQYDMSQFPLLAEKVFSNDIFEQHHGIIGIRKILSVDAPPIQPIIDANLVPRLIEFMKNDKQPHLQLEGAWALTNIASGTTAQTQTIIDKGGINLFIKLLSSPLIEVAEQAIWAIGNIAGDNPPYRDMIIDAGGIDPLIKILEKISNQVIIQQGTWALSNLCRGRPLPPYKKVFQTIPIFCYILKTQSNWETITDAVWALSYLSDTDNDTIINIIKSGVVPSLLRNFENPFLSVIIPTIRILGNLASGADSTTAFLLSQGDIIAKLFQLLKTTDKRHIKREILWALSNITAGSEQQITQIVREQTYVEQLLQLINQETDTKRESLWVLSNATKRGSIEDIKYLLMQYNILTIFINQLEEEDFKIVAIALEAIKNLLNHGDTHFLNQQNENVILEEFENQNGVKHLSLLQQHNSEVVYKKTLEIIEQYFDVEDPLEGLNL